MGTLRRALGTAAMLAIAAGTAADTRAQSLSDTRTAILRADDDRVRSEASRAAVAAGLAHAVPDVRVAALRAIGRTRRVEFLTAGVSALADPSLDVRREAAFAIAHIGSGDANASAGAEHAVREALATERDGLVLAALTENYGRLPFPTPGAIDVAATALTGARTRLADAGSLPPFVDLGVARGAEALARLAARSKATAEPLRALLVQLMRDHAPTPTGSDVLKARIRRLALMGMLAHAQPSDEAFDRALTDPDAQVRRLGVIAIARRPIVGEADARRWLADPAVLVRHAVAQRVGPKLPAVAEAALADAHVHVRLAAIDALGEAGGCRDACAVKATVPDAWSREAWHEPAHALVALARTEPARARPLVTSAAASRTWQVRMYAARAARYTGQSEMGAQLVADEHVNVRQAALAAWREAGWPGLADAAVAALSSTDGQLLLEAATALKGVAGTPAILEALQLARARLVALGHDTARDPREAIEARLTEAGAAALPPPAAAPVAPAPTWQTVQALSSATVTFSMRGGRRVVLRLYPELAPTAVARLVAQVRTGQWNGRTFHRVEPGFVVQGGSPAANEYAGASSTYARDEFSSLSHVRGAVGISTRGPDTGDGQIFIDLVDNPRLDFAFTIIGSVTGDLSLLDDIVEGEVIESAMVAVARR